jgi:hypothetical protein
MRTKGQGLPTPRCTRSSGLRQCVVASPNLSATSLSVNASRKVSGFFFRDMAAASNAMGAQVDYDHLGGIKPKERRRPSDGGKRVI